MAQHMRKSTSAQSAAHICFEIAAGLDSDPQTQDLAPLWDALCAKGDTLANQGLMLLRTLLKSRAHVTVRDSLWDAEVSAFARAVLDASNGKFDQIPNTRFFAKVKASIAQKFGIDREVAQGHAWIAELAREPAEPLAVQWTSRLSDVTVKLESASDERKNALAAVAMHGVGEILFTEEINVEIDRLEGELKKRFPRQPKRVAAYLAPLTTKRSPEQDDEQGEGAPETSEP